LLPLALPPPCPSIFLAGENLLSVDPDAPAPPRDWPSPDPPEREIPGPRAEPAPVLVVPDLLFQRRSKRRGPSLLPRLRSCGGPQRSRRPLAPCRLSKPCRFQV